MRLRLAVAISIPFADSTHVVLGQLFVTADVPHGNHILVVVSPRPSPEMLQAHAPTVGVAAVQNKGLFGRQWFDVVVVKQPSGADQFTSVAESAVLATLSPPGHTPTSPHDAIIAENVAIAKRQDSLHVTLTHHAISFKFHQSNLIVTCHREHRFMDTEEGRRQYMLNIQ